MVHLSERSPSDETTERTRRWALVFLLLAPPAIGELLSGSAPPLQFFHPVGFVLLVLFYGGGTLLIRELRARWHLGWPVLLLVVAYGILEEGTMMQSFFNHNHADLKELARYGMAGGIQWPWTIMLLFYHATMSTLVPITIADLLWPQLRDEPLLRGRGFVAAAAGVTLVTVLLGVAVWHGQSAMNDPYQPRATLLVGSVAVIAALVALAYALRRSVLRTNGVPLLPPVLFGVVAFFAQAANIIVPNALARGGVEAAATVGVQAVGVTAALVFAAFQLCHPDVSRRHLFALVFGSMLWFILVTPLHEFVPAANPDPAHGMLVVGFVALVLLVLLRWRLVASIAGR